MMVDKNELTLEELTIEDFVGIGLDYIQAHGDEFFINNEGYLLEALNYIYENHPDHDDTVAYAIERYAIYDREMLISEVDANIFAYDEELNEEVEYYANQDLGELKDLTITEDVLRTSHATVLREIAQVIYYRNRQYSPVFLVHDDLYVIRDGNK